MSRSDKIKNLFKHLQKKYKHVQQTQAKSVLDHLVFAACLENATFDQAGTAFAVLEHHYIDWNEIRVSTAAELAYTFPHLPDPMAAGERVRRALQAVFETTYMYDLEDLRKKSLSQSTEYMESLTVCSRFMINYTIQNALGGHVIPLDESSLKIFRRLDLTQVNEERTKEEVNGLERAIPKNQGAEFTNLLHQFASDHREKEDSKEVIAILKLIDQQSLTRDFTAPVLQTIKPQKPEKPKLMVPPMGGAGTLDDDMDVVDEPVGVQEVEFIPNPITGEESSPFNYDADDDDLDSSVKGKSSKKSKTASKAKSDKSGAKQEVKPAPKSEAKPSKTSPEPQEKKLAVTKPAAEKVAAVKKNDKADKVETAKVVVKPKAEPKSLKQTADKRTDSKVTGTQKSATVKAIKTEKKKVVKSDNAKAKTGAAPKGKPGKQTVGSGKVASAKQKPNVKKSVPANNQTPQKGAKDDKKSDKKEKSLTRELRQKKPK
ncbi:MAG: hypothetical protein ACRC2T_04325 [Thermoguttaceae bacterium]